MTSCTYIRPLQNQQRTGGDARIPTASKRTTNGVLWESGSQLRCQSVKTKCYHELNCVLRYFNGIQYSSIDGPFFLIRLSVHVAIVMSSTSSGGIVRIIAQCTVVFSNGLIQTLLYCLSEFHVLVLFDAVVDTSYLVGVVACSAAKTNEFTCRGRSESYQVIAVCTFTGTTYCTHVAYSPVDVQYVPPFCV